MYDWLEDILKPLRQWLITLQAPEGFQRELHRVFHQQEPSSAFSLVSTLHSFTPSCAATMSEVPALRRIFGNEPLGSGIVEGPV